MMKKSKVHHEIKTEDIDTDTKLSARDRAVADRKVEYFWVLRDDVEIAESPIDAGRTVFEADVMSGNSISPVSELGEAGSPMVAFVGNAVHVSGIFNVGIVKPSQKLRRNSANTGKSRAALDALGQLLEIDARRIEEELARKIAR